MSIEFLISVLRNAEVDARKAHHLAHTINQNAHDEKQIEALESYARNALVGINQAERMAEQIKAAAEEEQSK